MRACSILHPFGIGATEHQPHPAKEKKVNLVTSLELSEERWR
jgi:hypothetical protein